MTVSKKKLERLETWMIVLDAGADIFKEIRSVFEDSDWEEAVIINAIGSVRKGIIRYPKTQDLPPVVVTEVYEGSFELTSMVGTIRKQEGATNLHIHASFADKGNHFYGGAFVEGSTVYKKLEIFLIVKPGDKRKKLSVIKCQDQKWNTSKKTKAPD